MAQLTRLSLALSLALTGCGFPRPPTLGDDAAPGVIDAAPGSDTAPGIDAAPGTDGSADAAVSIDARPGTTIFVSGTGDDANDGTTAPVKTLKHAIGLAAANTQITSIVLASGRYESAGGETFPYTLPANLILAGPAGGGAILAGTDTEQGMIVAAGALQDLELENFSVAVTATGLARLTNLHIRTDKLAIRAESTAKLSADNVDITGAIGACAAGITLVGAAQLTSSTLATRNLGTALQVPDQSSADLTSANISGDRTCTATVLIVNTTKTFVMKDSVLDNGNNGALFTAHDPSAAPPHVTLTNTTIRNMKTDGFDGGDRITFVMTGGGISNNGGAGLQGGGGVYSFTNVLFQDNAFGMYLTGSNPGPSESFKLRGCTISGRGEGIELDNGASLDIGTAQSPGNNTLLSTQSVGLNVTGSTAPLINAVGNTWKPGVQGANSEGKYPAGTPPTSGQIPFMAGQNFAVTRTGISIAL